MINQHGKTPVYIWNLLNDEIPTMQIMNHKTTYVIEPRKRLNLRCHFRQENECRSHVRALGPLVIHKPRETRLRDEFGLFQIEQHLPQQPNLARFIGANSLQQTPRQLHPSFPAVSIQNRVQNEILKQINNSKTTRQFTIWFSWKNNRKRQMKVKKLIETENHMKAINQIDRLINQSGEWSFNQTFTRSINQLIKWTTMHSIKPSINQSIQYFCNG